MDSHHPATREELYHVQMEVKHVQATQNNHSDRLLRLEKRQADDAALKSVWSSPFPGVLSGTPQQGPLHNPSGDVFDDFDDDEHGQNILGSLQLEPDEEPVRRGASRANSVRFDVSASQGGNWAQGSRSSGDFGPARPNSGFGSHPIERSSSHKSDGRHSSAGHSVHSALSGRTSSLGLDTNFMIGGQDDDLPESIPEPPPGLFILGSVPSIIRCWLSTDFSHNSLLYAVICTGSNKSLLDYTLIRELGLLDQLQRNSVGNYNIRLPVYLPEAILNQPSSRPNSPAPQLPTLTANFEVTGLSQRSSAERKKGIRVFIGNDTLRIHSADLLLSQNIMILYGDDRNKLSVPFVRPEDDTIFKNLCITNAVPEKMELKATAVPFTPIEQKLNNNSSDVTNELSVSDPYTPQDQEDVTKELSGMEKVRRILKTPFKSDPENSNDVGGQLGVSRNDSHCHDEQVEGDATHLGSDNSSLHAQSYEASAPIETDHRESTGGIWGSWRQGSSSKNGTESSRQGASGSTFSRADRGGRNMKVLRPSKSVSTTSNRSSSGARTGATYEPASSHVSGDVNRKSHAGASDSNNGPIRWGSKSSASDEKPLNQVTNIPRSANPIGGAFSWLGPVDKQTPSTTAAD